MRPDLVVRNAVVHTPAGPLRGGLAVSGGRIVHVGSDESLPGAETVVDAGGNHLLPGIIDAHGIFGRVDWEPTAREESMHAAVNGVTTIITYVQMGDLTLPQRLPVHAEARELCERESFVDFKFNAALGTLEQIEEIPALVKDGVSSFNFWINLSMLEREQYGFPHLDMAFLYRALETIRDVGPPAFASVHCEEPEIIHMLFERARDASTGDDDLRTWAATRPSFTEGAQAFAAGLIGLELGVPIAFVHVSAPETLDAIRYLRGRGARVYGETSPQYLTVSPTEDLGLIGKQMPPLRDEPYQRALWQACGDGTISLIGSDHQIARRADKEDPGWWGTPNERAGSGGGLMGSIAPVMLSDGVNRNRITLEQFVQLTSENAAKLYGIYPTKGALAPGSDADMILVDMNREWTMGVESLKCSSDYCLWEGRRVKGRVVKTFVRGRLVAEDGELVADVPEGRHVDGVAVPAAV
jgi:dihydroorotase-like cyclic amidohydrolase